MHVPSQLTVDGREVPATAPQPVLSAPAAPVPLFTAPQTVRGQLAMPTDHDCAVCRPGRSCTYCTTVAYAATLAATDQPSLVRASLLACPDTEVRVQR